jgi:hypothetical protein
MVVVAEQVDTTVADMEPQVQVESTQRVHLQLIQAMLLKLMLVAVEPGV